MSAEHERASRVLLGVTGCIAAYKACDILRGLQKADVDVHVVMTEAATKFVTRDTFAALSGHPCLSDLFSQEGSLIPHIELTRDIDAFLIAPATADCLAKIAHGIADDLLTSSVLANTAPLIIAPAMNVHMYENVATQENLKLLRSRGVSVVDAQTGYLACGDVGVGKLADVQVIVDACLAHLEREGDGGASSHQRDLAGKHILVTAGPTVEPIDPVRFISNPSTGKMGYAIAEAAASRGAEVTLITGPTALVPPQGANTISVTTANEMLQACEAAFPRADIAIFTAAVSDMRPAHPSDRKLKKGIDDEDLSSLELVENPDILASLASSKRPDQVCIGFAAETEDVVDNARRKLISKKADMMVGNRVGFKVGFGEEESESVFVTENEVVNNGKATKKHLADKILTKASLLLHR